MEYYLSQKDLAELLPYKGKGKTLSNLLARKGAPTKYIREEIQYKCKGKIYNRLLYRIHFEMYGSIKVLQSLCDDAVIDYDRFGAMVMYNKKVIKDYKNSIKLIEGLIENHNKQ